MTSLSVLLFGLLIFLGPGAYTFAHARDELQTKGQISRRTFRFGIVAYFGHGTTTLVASVLSSWPLGLPWSLRIGAGGLLMVLGAMTLISARLQFRSFRQTWGLETNRLVTSGVYGISRNPQVLGALLFFLGASILGQSGVALGLVVALLIGSSLWLPVEESFLVRRFGAPYEHYRARVPRYFGVRGLLAQRAA